MSAPSLDSSLVDRAPLQLKGCPIVYIIKFTHCAIGGVAAPLPAHAGSPPLQHISAVLRCCYCLAPSRRPLRLLVAPCSKTWLRGRWYMSAAPARVQPRTLFPTSWTKGSTLTSVRASPWSEWLRFVQSYGFSGPADGCQLALTVSGLTPHDMVAQISSRTSSRRQRWTFLAPKLWKFLALSGLVWFGFCFPLPGVTCCRLVFRVLTVSLGASSGPGTIKDSTS